MVSRYAVRGPADAWALGDLRVSAIINSMDGAGYWVTERVLSPKECDAFAAELSHHTQSRGRAGVRHLMSNQKIVELASDNRLLQIARQALGASAIPYRATLFEKSGRANWLVIWHQDKALPIEVPFESEEWGPWSVKAGLHYAHAPTWALNRVVALRVHLDSSTGENGPLRVIPGSHREGVLDDQRVSEMACAGTAVECEIGSGGVLAMRPLLIHASSKDRSGESRRVIHIEYADSLELRPGIRLAVA
jgi:ectoine hydroxylase-related dioxygenase (phytanoyl-CoA dioxygenase family)